MKQIVAVLLLALGWLVWGGRAAVAEDGPTFQIYIPVAGDTHPNSGGQSNAACPHQPETLRYVYTTADSGTGGFHRHSFLVDYTISDPSYMYVAAEFQVAGDETLSDLVLTGTTPDDNLPIGTLRFGEYSPTPQLQNGETYYWRVRLLCTDLNGETQPAAWTQIEAVVVGE